MGTKDNDIDRLCSMVKECYDMSDWALGNGYGDNPIYKNLEHMVKIVDRIRLERIKEENKTLYNNLTKLGYTIIGGSENTNDVINYIRMKLLYSMLESFYKSLMEEICAAPMGVFVIRPIVHLLMDKEEPILTVMVDDKGNSFSGAFVIKLLDLVESKKYMLQLKFGDGSNEFN